jgi:hypothetical protein
MRAEENPGEGSPRCAGQAIGGRFLATGVPNASTGTHFGVLDHSAKELTECKMRLGVARREKPSAVAVVS